MSPWFDERGRLRVGWRFLLGAVVAVVANILAMDVADALAGAHMRLLDAVYRSLTMLLLLAGFSLLLVLADRVQGSPLAAMGLGRRCSLRQFAAGCAIGAGMICAAVAAIAVVGRLDFSISLTGRTAALACLELVVLLTGSMLEELMFRGYPFQRLLEGVGPTGAVAAVSVLFGLVHLGNPHASAWGLVNTVLVGVLLSVAYLRTRALWLPWGIHFAWNAALGLGFGLPVSGLTQFSVVVKAHAAGPQWLTGGGYGIEASALGTLVIVLGFPPLLWATRHACSQTEAAGRAGWAHLGQNQADVGRQIGDEDRSSDQPPLPGIQP